MQEIPKGVRYKKADASVNVRAKKKLHAIFDGRPTLANFDGVAKMPLLLGPGLWNAMKKAVAADFKTAKKSFFMVPNATGYQKLEGRIPRTPDQLETAWLCITGLAEKSGKATIRKAKAGELSYYWALISYNLEEPIYVVDCGRTKLIFDFDDNAKDPRPFFVDIVGKTGN